MNNILKHSGASSASVRVRRADGEVRAEIRDNGRGFDLISTPTSMLPGGGFGLQGLRERIAMLGGNLRIDSTPGAGTSLMIACPIASRRASPPEKEIDG